MKWTSIIIFVILVIFAQFAWAEFYQYDLPDSPAANSYTGNTYTELNWLDINISEDVIVSEIALSYSWQTDAWPAEATFLLRSPTGTQVIIASGEISGEYAKTFTDFAGETSAGSWRMWVQDTASDGGHSATGLVLRIYYNNPLAPTPPVVISPTPSLLNTPLSPSLSWAFTPANTDTYSLYIGQLASPSNNTPLLENIAVPSAGSNITCTLPSDLNTATKYYWQVAHYNELGYTTMGPVWNFTCIFPTQTTAFTEYFNEQAYMFNNNANNPDDFLATSTYAISDSSIYCAYDTGNSEYIFSSIFELTPSIFTNPIISFWQMANTEVCCDKAYIEISADHGSSWQALGGNTYTGAGTYLDDGFFNKQSYPTWDDADINNNEWRYEKFSLSGISVPLQFRFRLNCDASQFSEGWWLDNIYIGENTNLAPAIYVEALTDTYDTALRNVVSYIHDDEGISSGPNAPRIYSRHLRSESVISDWQSTSFIDNEESNYIFSFDYPVIPHDIIEYFVIASDGDSLTISPSAGAEANSINDIITPPNAPYGYTILDSPPTITLSPLSDTFSTISRNFTALITDNLAVDIDAYPPRAWYRISGNAWQSSAYTDHTDDTWTFEINITSLAPEDIIEYYVCAQDFAGNISATPHAGFVASNTASVTSHPTAPYSYQIMSSYSENFDSEHPGWEHETAPHPSTSWTLQTGSTTSSATGPAGDHTTGSGYYYYTEASGNYQKNAYLLSPPIDLSGLSSPQAEFWYHMRGASMGSLDIDLLNITDATSIENVIPTLASDAGDTWHLQAIPLSSLSDKVVRIRFRAQIGTSFNSDICIDDFVIKDVPSLAPSLSISPLSHDFGLIYLQETSTSEFK